MFRSSETIGIIASALARAQAEIVHPEKLLVATLRSPSRQDLPLCRALQRPEHRSQIPRRERNRDRADDGDRSGRRADPPHHGAGPFIGRMAVSGWPVC